MSRKISPLSMRLMVAGAVLFLAGTSVARAQISLPPATGVTITADKPSPQVTGTPVVFTASGIGSSGYQYRFFIRNLNSTTWTLVQDYGVGSTWALPATTAPGGYRVVVHVRTSPTVALDAQAGVKFTVSLPPATGVTLTADKASPQLAGTPVVFTASGIGSSGYQYRFFIRDVNSPTWTLVQDYGVGSAWTLPTSTPSGTYRIVVHVRTSTAVSLDAQAGITFTLTAPPAPTVATIAPATGTSAGGDTVVITGTNFDPGVTVDFGGFFLGTVTLATATSITVTTPPHPIGAFDVIITNPNNQSTVVLGGFTFTAPVTKPPRIASITPATDSAAGGSTVTIAGVDFAPGATASFGGAPATILGGAVKSMLVTVPAHAAGIVDVIVTNPDGQFATLVGGFNYTPIPAATPAPTISSVVASSGPDVGGSAIAVNGTNFVLGTKVMFGGVAGIVQSFTSTSIVVVTPPGPTGFVDVTVVNPDGQSATLVGVFRYVSPGPNILTLNIHGSPMAGGTLVLIAGTGFQTGATVTFGGVPGIGASYDPVNKVISVTTPPGPANAAIGPSGAPEAFVSVVVTNPDGQSSAVLGFHYGPPPIATDFFSDVDGTKTLNNGKAGQVIDIIGSQFSVGPGRGVQVLFAGPSAGLGTVNQALSSATTLSVGIPKLNPGVYQIIVTNFDGQFTTAPGALTILGP